MVEQEMVELNFGPDEADMYDPGPGQDLIVSIPKTGSLEKPYRTDYPDFENRQPEVYVLEPYYRTGRTFPAVRFPLGHGDRYTRENDMLMLWIEERREWVAIEYEKWKEDSTKNAESYRGPFGLDDFCEKMLLKGYGINIHSPMLGNVKKKSPSELERIASQN